MNLLHHVTTSEDAGLRLDRVLSSLAPDVSRAALQKAIRAGRCCIDGIPVTNPNMRLHPGQALALRMPDTVTSLQAEAGHVELLWQDAHLIVCNKPAGLTVHPCPSCPEHTLVQRLLAHIPELGAMEGLRPGIVHRLDKNTSGLMVVALTEADRLALSTAFARREVHKEYLALVSGTPPLEGCCTEPLGRSSTSRIKMAIVPESRGGRAAHTQWRRLWAAQDGRFSLLAVRILTGRTHQIRVHMAHLGHPLLGDTLYAPRGLQAMAPRQMLHAWHLSFTHPATGAPMQFTCAPPPDMTETVVRNCRRMQRVVVTGNPGCGKSLFTQRMELLGVPSISADHVVAELYAKGGEAVQWIHRLGDDLLTAAGAVDKAALLTAMRNKPGLKREVERIVHALTRQAIDNFWAQQEASGTSLAVAEVPLYFETGWREAFTPKPFVVGVHCPLALRTQRLQTNRGWSQETISTIESWQWPEERKLAACDMVVDNTGTQAQLHAQAKNLLAQLATRKKTSETALCNHLAALWTQQDASNAS